MKKIKKQWKGVFSVISNFQHTCRLKLISKNWANIPKASGSSTADVIWSRHKIKFIKFMNSLGLESGTNWNITWNDRYMVFAKGCHQHVKMCSEICHFTPVVDLMPTLSWRRHQMKTFPVLLALCDGNPPPQVDSPHKGQWRGALMLSSICAWTNGWANNRAAGDLRCHRAHYNITVMIVTGACCYNNNLPTTTNLVPWHLSVFSGKHITQTWKT